MRKRLAGRGPAALTAVLIALFTIVDVASRALAPWLGRVRESRVFALLGQLGRPDGIGAYRVAVALAYGWLWGGSLLLYLGVIVRDQAGAATSTNFPDALDARFAKIYDERYKQLSDMIARFFAIVGPGQTPQKQDYRTSSVGSFADVPELTGSVSYDEVYEGYDGTITPKEYASGFQIQRKLFADASYGIMDAKPRSLATAYQRTRQKHAAQFFNNGFSNDTTWNNFTENVAPFSNSHTTRASGVSTASGFDNLVTTAFSAATLIAIRTQMKGFRGDRGDRISVMPKLIIHPVDISDLVFEAVKSMGKPDTAENNANFLAGQGWESVEWEYLTDTNNYFVADPVMMKDSLTWFEREAMEFAMVEDFDTLVGKWRLYGRYGHGYNDWRFGCGAQVS